jgi:hypothetical protein
LGSSGSEDVFRSTAAAHCATAAGNWGTTVHELIQDWLEENGESWKKKLASRSGLSDVRSSELLEPAVATLCAVLRRGRLDLAAFVRGADPAGLVAMADSHGLAMRHGLDQKVAQSALSAIAPSVLEAARRAVRTEAGVQRMLETGATANQVGAIGDLANRLYRQRAT